MREPIFAYEPIDLAVFRTVADAELYFEAPEINDNSLLFFDAEGRILKASVANNSSSETIILTDEHDGINPSFLRQLITEFLQTHDYEASKLDRMELPELIKESLRFTTK